MTIKTMLFGFAALGVGGAALTGGGLGGGHDAERTIARPPAEVYAAIASMATEGVVEREAEPGAPPVTFEVRKEPGKAVHYLLRIDGKVAGSVDLAVAPDKDGAASRLSADIELDQAALRKLAGDGPEEFPTVPDALLDIAAGQMLGEMAARIEAGTPLEPFGPDDMAAWQGHAPGAAEREATQAAAAA
ncbi:MAG TPA: hypothetical protein VF547_10590, partial [Allosphingosinicella sp.]